MTETDAGTEAKNGRTESLESWNTVDINEDTVDKMKKSKVSMRIVIGFNVFISIIVGVLSLECEYSSDPVKQCPKQRIGFGFTTYGQFLFDFVMILQLLYIAVIFMYLPVMFKISGMFMITYPDLYQVVKCKLTLFLVVFEMFMIIRALNYMYA